MRDEDSPAFDREPRLHGEGALYLYFMRPDGQIVWEGLIETPLDYRGQGAKRVPGGIDQLLADFPRP